MTAKRHRAGPTHVANVSVNGRLTADEVRRIHDHLCDDFAAGDDPIDPPGVRSQALLESAVGRQDTGLGPHLKYPTALANAATLAYGLCQDHPFHNGNKRTALVAMLAHLDRNKLALHKTKQSELFDLILDLAQSQLSLRDVPARSRRRGLRPTPDAEVEALASWLCRRTHAVERGEQELTFRELRQVLRRFEYDFEAAKGNTIDVVKLVRKQRGLLKREPYFEHKRIGSLRYPGDGRVVGVAKIKQVRRMCRLTEEDGVDSATFYAGADRVDLFINEYRTVLRRLARR